MKWKWRRKKGKWTNKKLKSKINRKEEWQTKVKSIKEKKNNQTKIVKKKISNSCNKKIHEQRREKDRNKGIK